MLNTKIVKSLNIISDGKLMIEFIAWPYNMNISGMYKA